VGADEGVFAIGDAVLRGSAGATPAAPRTPVVGMAGTPDGGGYWLVTTDRTMPHPATTPPGPGPVQRGPDRPSGRAEADHPGLCGRQRLARPARLVVLELHGGRGPRAVRHNNCDPDCAEGTFVSAPATVQLAYLVDTSAGEEFGEISFEAADRAARPGSRSYAEAAPTSP
jgi:hypothetical protein